MDIDRGFIHVMCRLDSNVSAWFSAHTCRVGLSESNLVVYGEAETKHTNGRRYKDI